MKGHMILVAMETILAGKYVLPKWVYFLIDWHRLNTGCATLLYIIGKLILSACQWCLRNFDIVYIKIMMSNSTVII